MPEHFLQRWSRRKAESGANPRLISPIAPGPPLPAGSVAEPAPPAEMPTALPTLRDVAALAVDADYTPFVARGLDQSVHRAAMKKLFSDPHFNVLDGLDIYMDDYNRPSPMSAAMLAALTHAGSTLNPQPVRDATTTPATAADTADNDDVLPDEHRANDLPPGDDSEPAEPQPQVPVMLPKLAALLADAAGPAPDPVPAVHYRSQGRTLIIGGDTALTWARQLCSQLDVTVLLTDHAARLPTEHDFPVLAARDIQLTGWLGAFDAAWQPSRPIDLARPGLARAGSFDLVFDLSTMPVIPLHQPPQGYFAPGADLRAQIRDAAELVELVGEFEKPRYFQYKERLCAHQRNGQSGCTACIDICSAQAIVPDGDHVKVNPYLCAGCGACSTVCPSGALRHVSPTVPHTGRRCKALLETYAAAGGEHACLLLHDAAHGTPLIRELERQERCGVDIKDVAANVLPLELPHVASTGIDVWLGAIAYGAMSVRILCTGDEAPAYRVALKAQAAIAQAILDGFGLAPHRVDVFEAGTVVELAAALYRTPDRAPEREPGLESCLEPAFKPAAGAPVSIAKFALFDDKRNSLDFILAHLYAHAPLKNDTIALPSGAPFGTLAVNGHTCTLCMACTGACPSAALMSGDGRPQLRFIEKNCIQCSLCVQTCPEAAITLVPRLSMQPAARAPVTLNEAEPFCCIVCSKPIGTVKVIENLLLKLGRHSAFSGHPERLRMCADCRVVDMMAAGGSATTGTANATNPTNATNALNASASAGVRDIQRPRS